MSKVLKLKLSRNKSKPLFNAYTQFDKKVLCLLDTGATMPVWCKSEALFKVLFPNATLLKNKFILSGFGKQSELVDVYSIPSFYLKDSNNRLEFKNLHIATSFNRDFGCDLILSYTMFNHMDLSIKNRLGKSEVEIVYDRDEYFTSVSVKNNLVNKLFSFAEEIKDTAAAFRELYDDKFSHS